MRKKIVKALLLIPATLVLLLSTLALSGCHDDNDDVTMVMYSPLQTKVPYNPIDISSFKGTLGDLVMRDYKGGITVFMGTWNGDVVYDYWASYMSDFDGFIYDINGELLPQGIYHIREMNRKSPSADTFAVKYAGICRV